MRSSSAGDASAFVGLTGPAGVRHQPGLDGLRGLAVAAVVLFHTAVGLVALAGNVAMWLLLDVGTDGLLPLTAVTSSATILATMLPGPVRTVATVRPLRWLGGISYRLYLIHWPVLVALDHVVPAPGIVPIVIAVAASVAVAWLCAVVLELPARSRRVRARGLVLGGRLPRSCWSRRSRCRTGPRPPRRCSTASPRRRCHRWHHVRP